MARQALPSREDHIKVHGMGVTTSLQHRRSPDASSSYTFDRLTLRKTATSVTRYRNRLPGLPLPRPVGSSSRISKGAGSGPAVGWPQAAAPEVPSPHANRRCCGPTSAPAVETRSCRGVRRPTMLDLAIFRTRRLLGGRVLRVIRVVLPAARSTPHDALAAAGVLQRGYSFWRGLPPGL
jgi:hypothetical protein